MNTEETTDQPLFPEGEYQTPFAIFANSLNEEVHKVNPNARHDIGLQLADIADNAASTWVNYTGHYINPISIHKLKVIIGHALIEAISHGLVSSLLESCQISCATACRGFKDCKVDQLAIAALGGRSIQSEGPSESECEGDRPDRVTPKESVISVEALEKEPGWEITPSAFGRIKFRRGKVTVIFDDLTDPLIAIGMHIMEGVSSMQDLRQLEQLVNG